MAESAAGQKQRMSITRCKISPGGSVALDQSASFTVMLNPSEFSHDYTICYNTKKTLGQVGSDAKFSAINPDKIGFSLILDGTGAVPRASESETVKDVRTQLEDLNKVVYMYVGDEHEPNHVDLRGPRIPTPGVLPRRAALEDATGPYTTLGDEHPYR